MTKYCFAFIIVLCGIWNACNSHSSPVESKSNAIPSGWIEQSSGVTADLYSVYFIDVNNGIVVGKNGTILRTSDGGNNWKLQTSGSTANLSRVTFVDHTFGTIIGDGGTILCTSNGGKSWTPQISGTNSNLQSISFIDANDGAVVGDSTILLTKDGGTNWIHLSLVKWDTLNPPFPPIFTDVSFPDINHIFIFSGGLFEFMFRTTNGGENWLLEQPKISPTEYLGFGNRPRSIFWDKNIGMVFDREYFTSQSWINIYKTTDGGISWAHQGISNGLGLNDLSFPDPNTGTIVGDITSQNGNKIQHTTDGGKTWTIQPITTSAFLNGVFFIDANIGTIVGTGGTILHTTTGGM